MPMFCLGAGSISSFTLTIWGQEAAKAAPPELPFFMNPLVLIGIMAAFYLLIILPASRRQKREFADMLASLKTGQKVITNAGLIGTVVRVKDGEDEVVIRSEDSKLRIQRASIVRVLQEDAATSSPATESK
jgi:preprotein translocase subunit YajC